MDSSLHEVLVFLFSIAFQQYTAYDTSPPVAEIRQEMRIAADRGERYKFKLEPPEIRFVPHLELQKMAGCENKDCHFFGWYQFGAGKAVINLSDHFTLQDVYEDPFVQSVIAHEDTHYLQDYYGFPRATCQEQWQIERDAYNTQFRYLSFKHYANKVALPPVSAFCPQQ